MIVAEREMPMTQCTRTRFAYKYSISARPILSSTFSARLTFACLFPLLPTLPSCEGSSASRMKATAAGRCDRMSSYSESSTAMQRCRGFCTLGGQLSSLPFVFSG